jgi:hypothetical protein
MEWKNEEYDFAENLIKEIVSTLKNESPITKIEVVDCSLR